MILDYINLVQSDWFLYLNLALSGLIAGSFCTTLIHRLPLMIEKNEGKYSDSNLSLSFPASHCPQCKTSIPYYLNLPVIGYLLARGKCASCGCTIAWYYPFTELGCLLLALIAGWFFGANLILIPILLLLWSLLTLSIIDIRSGLLPDLLTLSLLWLGLLLNPLLPYASLVEAVWGAASIYVILTGVNFVYQMIRKRVGIGGGDIKLFAALGAYFGWQSILPLLLLASCSGLILALVVTGVKTMNRENNSKSTIALASEQRWGPSIAFAAVIYLVVFEAWPQLLTPFSF